MRVLVTGGAGFIGSYVAEAYLTEGHDVAIVDDLSTGDWRNLPSDTPIQPASLLGSGDFANETSPPRVSV